MRRGTAFTLLELVLAMAATSLILGAAYTALFTGLNSYDTNAYKSEIRSILFRSLTRILDDLRSAQVGAESLRFLIESSETETEAEGGQAISDDRILFTAAIARTQWENKPQSDLSEIEFYIDRDDETPARWLVRRTDNPPDGKPLTGGEIHLVGPRIVGMEIRAYDGSKWVEEWDSSSELPAAVQVTLFIGPTRETIFQNRFESLSGSVWLPTSKPSASSASETGGKGAK